MNYSKYKLGILCLGLVCIFLAGSCKRQSDTAAAIKLAKKDPVARNVLPFVQSRLVRDVKISPQGTYLAMNVPMEDSRALVILRLADKAVVNTIAFQYPDMVGDYVWASDTTVVIELAFQKGSLAAPVSRGELYSMDVTKQRGRIIFGFRAGGKQTGTNIKQAESDYAWANVIAALPEDPGNILISSQPMSRDREINPTICRLDVERGRKKTLATSPVANARFVVDPSGQVRFATGQDEHGKDAVFFRKSGSAPWERAEKLKEISKKTTPIRFMCDANMVLVEDSSHNGVPGLYTINLETGERKQVFQHEEVEATGVVLDPATCEILAVEYQPDYPTYQFLNKQHPISIILGDLIKRFGGNHVVVTSMTLDGKKMVVLSFSDRQPGRYYLVDVAGQKDTPVYDRLQGDLSVKYSEMRAFKLNARDGMKLTGYITFPAGLPERNLPMVVLPHGGPHWIRDTWGWESEVQMLASQGFAVLQVNFRGSGGFGEKFLKAGYREWGSKVQEDIIDATRWAVSEGIADKDRICIFGSSFGAYSAMQSAILAPDLYKCAVGYSGIYDLQLMYELGDIQDRRSGRVYLQEAIGKDAFVLKQLSPAHNADKIKIPVMLAHGEEDERAPIEHALAMKKALEINGIECKWMVKPKESHGFFTKSNQVEFYSHLVKFLRKHIQPERFTARQIIDVHAAAKFGKADLAKALKHTKNNREEVRNSRQCGCYFCSHIFSPTEIKEYKEGNSAVCPKCGTDSVIGSASGYPITSAFLKKLREYWLSKD